MSRSTDAVGEVGEMHLDFAAQVADVVERAARGCAYERVHARPEQDERLGQMRAHESVRAGDQDSASAVHRLELLP